MNKKLKVFLKIVYYFFTFGLGIILAVALPNAYFYKNVPEQIEKSVQNKQFDEAIGLLVGAYYDNQIAAQTEFADGSGIVLFRSAVLVEQESEKQLYQMHFAYTGLFYQVPSGYAITDNDENLTKLLVTNQNNQVIPIELLNNDTNDDKINDEIISLKKYDFIYFEILQEQASSISKIAFIDARGNECCRMDVTLDFENSFFTSLHDFVQIYNQNSASEELSGLEKKFLESNTHYLRTNYEAIAKKSNKQATIFVLIYFVFIYILGDMLVGQHYIIRFFRWLFSKMKKNKLDTENVLGQDYYTNLTLQLHVPEGFSDIIHLQYYNDTATLDFTFSKDTNYIVSSRAHAGKYKLMPTTKLKNYKVTNLPNDLLVNGYKKTIDITFENLEQTENVVEDESEK